VFNLDLGDQSDDIRSSKLALKIDHFPSQF